MAVETGSALVDQSAHGFARGSANPAAARYCDDRIGRFVELLLRKSERASDRRGGDSVEIAAYRRKLRAPLSIISRASRAIRR